MRYFLLANLTYIMVRLVGFNYNNWEFWAIVLNTALHIYLVSKWTLKQKEDKQ